MNQCRPSWLAFALLAAIGASAGAQPVTTVITHGAVTDLYWCPVPQWTFDMAEAILGRSGRTVEPRPWDCGDGDGLVGIVDFLAQWDGTGSSCDLGLGGAGVGIEEFLDLLANWGPCP